METATKDNDSEHRCKNDHGSVKLSVIIPCYNAAATIADQLESLSQQEWSQSWEIVVADNGSTDVTLEIVERFRSRLPALRVVDASSRRGAAHARNVAAAVAEGEAFAFCDADDVIAPGWVAAMGWALEEHEFVASRFDMEKLSGGPSSPARRKLQHGGPQRLWYPPYVSHAGTCGLAVRREYYEALGGLDENLLCLHDTDFCLRMHLAGVDLHFVPEAVVYVRRRPTLRGRFHQARCWAQENELLYKTYCPSGMKVNRAWGRYLHEWYRVLRRLPKARSPRVRAALAWSIGWQIGLLAGCIKYKTVPVDLPRQSDRWSGNGQRRPESAQRCSSTALA
jgi:glycosyltransferase involved in cell wall biosynthesis